MLRLKQLPARIAIIGGGVIGCGCLHLWLVGLKVTIIEALPALLPMVDYEISRQLSSYFKRRGINLMMGAKVEAVKKDDELTVAIAGGQSISCDMVLIAIGRRPNSSGLNLDRVGVELHAQGEIMVDATMATTAPGVYAIGDVAATPWKLAHVARQGFAAHVSWEKR